MSKQKAKKPSAEERLIKEAQYNKEMEATLSVLMPPKVWLFVETLCRLHMQASNDSPEARDLVAQFALACRQEGLARFGHDSLESFALVKLLRAGPRWNPKPPRLDAITYINNQVNRGLRLSMHQEEAANHIVEVWQAYGKFLEITGRGLGGGGGARSRAQGPVDVMGEELWAHHRDIYTPWYRVATLVPVARRHAGPALTMAALVFKILVEDIYPEEADRNYALLGGTALKALKVALDSYSNPLLLANWGKPKVLEGSNPGK